MATADTLLVACLVSIVGGAGNGVQWIAVVTALQEATPADYQARIVGLLESLGAAMPGVGYLLGGALVAIGSPRTAYAFAGAGVLLLVFAGFLLRSRIRVVEVRLHARRRTAQATCRCRTPRSAPAFQASDGLYGRRDRPNGRRQRARTLEPHVT